MNRTALGMIIIGFVGAAALLPAVGLTQQDDPKKKAEPKSPAADMAAMMEKAKRFTEPGKNHKTLERFLGKWDTELRFFLGAQATPPEKGTSEFSWLIEGRWLKSETKGTMMGRPAQTFHILGYDSFKQSFVSTTVSNMDTAMNHSEGDMAPAARPS